MPFPSSRTSKMSDISNTMEVPMNYQGSKTKEGFQYLKDISNTSNLAFGQATSYSSHAKTPKRNSKQPQVETVMKPDESLTTYSFKSSEETEIPTEDKRCISRRSFFESKSNKDFDVGEPARFQHLTIDFTPIKGVDDDEQLQQKCIDFWEFVKSEPMLTKIMAVPIKINAYDDDIDKMVYNVENVNNQNVNVLKGKTAVQWTERLPLNYLGKLSYKYCPEPPSSYKHRSEKSLEGSESSLKLSKPSTWTIRRKKDTPTKDVPKSATSRAREDVKKVCADMEEFDQKHPRTFDPPTAVPTLISAKMQRFLPSMSSAPLYAD